MRISIAVAEVSGARLRINHCLPVFGAGLRTSVKERRIGVLRADGGRAGGQSLAKQAKQMSKQSCHGFRFLRYTVAFAFFARI